MINFFCPAHRDWVYLNCDKALENSFASEQSGNTLMQNGLFADALAHLGCAYEAVEIFLQMHGTQNWQHVTRLTTLSLATAQCCYELRQYDNERAILQRCIAFLSDRVALLKRGSKEREFMQFCLESLHECLPYTSMSQVQNTRREYRFH